MKTKDKTTKQWITLLVSVILKLTLVIFVIIGICKTMGYEGFMGGAKALLYFTIQSNITIAIVMFAFAIINCVEFFTNKKIINNLILKIKFSFTTAIAITGFVFTLILAPRIEGVNLFNFINFALHVFVPILAIVDFYFFDYELTTKPVDCLLAAPMPLFYLIFALIVSTTGVVYNNGTNVPYFFLDYKTLGWFSMDKGLGVAYWIIILFVAIMGLSALMLFVKNLIFKIHIKRNKHNITTKN
ncbi:MAG: Pr6Pr family membrane protein [Clostridia bacterium]